MFPFSECLSVHKLKGYKNVCFQGSFTDVILGFLTYDPETEKEAMKWLHGNQKSKANTGTQTHKLFLRLTGEHQHVISLLPVHE